MEKEKPDNQIMKFLVMLNKVIAQAYLKTLNGKCGEDAIEENRRILEGNRQEFIDELMADGLIDGFFEAFKRHYVEMTVDNVIEALKKAYKKN